MRVPIVDNRSNEIIYKQLIKLARNYVPEWNGAKEGDLGVILSHLFANMMKETIQRFNKIPYKNFIYFLNILGADTLPGICSKGYVTIDLNPGTEPGVVVAKGKHLFAQDDGGNRVLFEVEDELLAIDNKVKEILCKSSTQGKIVRSFDEKVKEDAFKLFDFNGGENLQCYRFVFDEQNVLHINNGAEITLQLLHDERPYLENQIVEKLKDKTYAKWEYLTEEGWQPIQEVTGVDNTLHFKVTGPILEAPYNELVSRWLSCTLMDPVGEAEICFTQLRVASQAEGILPDSLYNNDLSLIKTTFLPFNERFSSYDDFYINSKEAFCKKGAIVKVEMVIDHILVPIEEKRVENKIKWKPILRQSELTTPQETEINVEKVIWEYWNGNGWKRLFDENLYEDIFKLEGKQKVTLTFTCPTDMDTTYIGADQGLWIRARILSVNNAFALNTYFNSPIIEKITISYSYRNEMQPVERIFLERDLEKRMIANNQREEIKVYSKETDDRPAAYLALNHPIKGGPIKIFFKKVGQDCKEPPAIKWEYWGLMNGTYKWIELKLMDETENMSKSGLITFVVKDNFEKAKLFGKEEYWLRIVNTDKRYDEEAGSKQLPELSGIYFNTVKIVQQETMETEYFFMELEEANKLCVLTQGNLTHETVWVDELDDLLADDISLMSEETKREALIEKDESGMPISYWVKWERISNIKEAGPEDRVYMLDEKRGRVLFGDGKHGKIPNASYNETIRIDYSVGMGDRGNFEAFSIDGFSDAVPFVNRVYNIEPIAGGCDVETLEEAIRRNTKLVRHQDKAVSIDDYDSLVRAADRNIVRVKAMSCINEEGEVETGCVTIAILPRYANSVGNYFLEIKENVMRELQRKGPALLTYSEKFKVREVQYIEFCVSVKANIENYNDYQNIYKQIDDRLEEYLDPIKGNFDGKGFEIGVLPTKTQIYNYIKGIPGIITIDNVMINCYERIRESRREIDYYRLSERPYAVPMSGTHTIEITVL